LPFERAWRPNSSIDLRFPHGSLLCSRGHDTTYGALTPCYVHSPGVINC
jgi:hypothetical protein